MKLEIIIERSDNELWGRIENMGDFMPVSVGKSKQELVENIKTLILDYLQQEGKSDKAWKKYKGKEITFTFLYDLQAFFLEHEYLNQSKIAVLSGINPGLLRQYTSGVKFPSSAQAHKIQKVIQRLARELSAVSFYV